MLDQQVDQRIGARSGPRPFSRASDRRPSPGMRIRFLARIELRVDEKAVLEIVDAERERLPGR
jgi:hypothetical protein